MNFTSPVAKEAVAAYADEQGNLRPSRRNGTFRLVKWERNHEIVLEKNPTFRTEFYPNSASQVYRKGGLLADAGRPIPFSGPDYD